MILGAPVGLVSLTGVYLQPVLNRFSLDKGSVQRYRRCWMKSTSAKRLHGGLKSPLSSIDAPQLIEGLRRNCQEFAVRSGELLFLVCLASLARLTNICLSQNLSSSHHVHLSSIVDTSRFAYVTMKAGFATPAIYWMVAVGSSCVDEISMTGLTCPSTSRIAEACSTVVLRP